MFFLKRIIEMTTEHQSTFKLIRSVFVAIRNEKFLHSTWCRHPTILSCLRDTLTSHTHFQITGAFWETELSISFGQMVGVFIFISE